MSKLKELTPLFADVIPDKLVDGILYISTLYSTAIHKCACGCGHSTVTPLSPDDWRITLTDAGVSLAPSIGNFQFQCKSHYYVRNNKVIWM